MHKEVDGKNSNIMNGNPFFSIIVPVYNEGDRLRRAVSSVMTQSINDYELIVVDDGSDDTHTLTIFEEYEKIEGIKIIHKKNGGVSSARNVGIREAKGDYLIFLDGDDWIEKDTCEFYKNKLLEYVDADVLFPNYFTDDEINRKTHLVAQIDNEIVFIHSPEKAICTAFEHDIVNNRGCVRRKFLMHNGLFVREDVVIAEDLDFILRSLLAAKKIVLIPTAKYHYCIYQKHGKLTWPRFESQIRISSDWIDMLLDEKYGDAFRLQISRIFADMMCVYLLRILELDSQTRKKGYAIFKEKIGLLKCGGKKTKIVAKIAQLIGVRITVFCLGNLYYFSHRNG